MACPIRRACRRTDTRWTVSTRHAPASPTCSSTCSVITRPTSRSIRPSSTISAPTSRPSWRLGADMIRSFCRRAPRRSSATSRTRRCASSIQAISLWRRMPQRSRRRSENSFRADFASRETHDMEKSVAIVTGASQGIGRSTAIRLARDFSALVLVARDRAKLEGTAEAVKAAGAKALVLDSDLSEPEAAKSVVDQALAAFDRIDALLNIAGAVPQIDLFEMTDAQWEAGLALKLHGARRLTIAAWPALKTAKGAVVLMSGNSALFPKAPYAAVGTINAAIVALAKAFSDRGVTDGGQQRAAGPRDDRPSPLLPGALGAAARNDRR